MLDASRMSFLGTRGLARLRAATVTVLGAGGGGSHMVQQLAHMAIGRIVVIDPDRLDASNVNRVVGAGYADIGRLKTEILVERFSGLGAQLEAVPTRAETADGCRWMERSNLVFGALDGFRPRDNVERICRSALVPYIDIGLKIVADRTGAVTAVGGQVVTSVPNGPCLRCAGIITDENLARDREEYAAGPPEQQVISMNGLLASQAVTIALALLTGFTTSHSLAPHLLYDGLEHSLRTNTYLPDFPCPHYPLQDAGWAVVLPPKRGAS